MRPRPLVLLALIALVAPSQAHAQVAAQAPTRSVRTIDGVGFFVGIEQSARSSARPDDVVARLMSFDRNHDGKLEKDELAERMYTVMDRGDANGDGCLDRTELAALAAAKPAPAAVRGFGHGGYMVGSDTAVSSRQHLEGALDDLRLEGARKEPALAIVTTFSQTLDAAAQTELLDVMKAILNPEQLTKFTTGLEQERRLMGAQRVLTSVVTSNDQQVKTVTFGSLAMSERAVATFRLAPEANERAMAALKQYRSRMRPNETERVELGRQLASVLTREESDNFVAAIARQPVADVGVTLPVFRKDF
jgi:Ca2+-binding EF-hand superfamily protein